MSGDRRKINKQSTGTVPKVKTRNNTSSCLNEGNNSPHSLTNNLVLDWQRVDQANFVRNSRKNTLHSKYRVMEAPLEEQQENRQNGNTYINSNVNGTTPNTSSSTSRRNSSSTVPKCDNVYKYPDKKQVEDKLSQIREYLKITTSLMSSMKLSDEQQYEAEYENFTRMIADLKDSEAKLLSLCGQINEGENDNENYIQEYEEVKENGTDSLSEAGTSHSNRNDPDREKIEQTSREIENLKEQQLSLIHLQQKAENKLREARSAQDRLVSSQRHFVNNMPNRSEKNFAEIDEAIRELEERTKKFNQPRNRSATAEEQALVDRVDALQNQIAALHNANDDREYLIQVLDNRDAELRTQHVELQAKLSELQNRKKQVDELVTHLHVLDEANDGDDVGIQVKKIVSMKEQLSKLKDMLEIVQNTEFVFNNQNSTPEEQAIAYDICTKAENFLQNNMDMQKQRAPSESNFSLCYENNAVPSHNEHLNKQVNKSASERQGAKPKRSAVDELEAKKRELEAIMGKHKAGTSNLNHDVGGDHKMEFAASTNSLFDAASGQWVSVNQHNNSSDRYSSRSSDEGGDVNEYSELTPPQNHLPTFTLSSEAKHRSDNARTEYVQPIEYERLRSVTRTPDRNTRNSSVCNYDYPRDRARSNSTQDNSKSQVQKQLELIKSVCESMLDQSTNLQQQSNVQQVRNNLTPSPIYSEPRRFTSPNPHPLNAVNVINSNLEMPCMSVANAPADPASYQNWLMTNSLQSQAFMLNTLNQCYQMLWLQQREMTALRSAIATLQERLDHCPPYDAANHLVSPMQHSNSVEPRSSSNQFRSNQQKVNQVSAACSMPNLNHYNMPSANLPDGVYSHPPPGNMQSARLLDSCLNNASNMNTHHADFTNNMLHVNPSINQPLPGQIWNGQALNNQVAPGNRANNYWDNFRSYSRQNLLSSKSNEGLHNFTMTRERSSNTSHPFALVAPCKSNSEQESSTSQENTPRRQVNVPPKRRENYKKTMIPPPDVLNINHNITRSSEPTELLPENRQVLTNDDEQAASYQSYLNNAFGGLDSTLNPAKVTEDQIIKDCIPENCRRRNEWHDNVENEQHLPKSKLFEELRENVYREVATLISTNEARPHFLIQLFKDLQMVSSDTLRLKILQMIQGIITHQTQSVSTQASSSNEPSSEHESSQQNSFFMLQSTVWPKMLGASCGSKNETDMASSSLNPEDTEMHETLKEIIPFLNDHEDEIIQPHFLLALKRMLVSSESFQELVKDTIFQKHFSNVLDEVLEQYVDKKIKDVKIHLIQTLSDILRGELSFIQLIQDSCPENCESNGNHELPTNNMASLPFVSNSTYEYQSSDSNHLQPANSTVTPVQNGDLAEADQSRVEDEEIEEEGAVGGFLGVSQEHLSGSISSNIAQVNTEDVDLPTIHFPGNVEQSESQFVKQGLDQVPTRLDCRSKSRSNTPSRDRSSSSRSEHHSDHYQ